jgi:hypothetical protein
MPDLEARATRTPATTGALHCITQDAEEPAAPEFLAACDDNPVDVTTSRYCPPECGGHPICAPCRALTRQAGLVAE